MPLIRVQCARAVFAAVNGRAKESELWIKRAEATMSTIDSLREAMSCELLLAITLLQLNDNARAEAALNRVQRRLVQLPEDKRIDVLYALLDVRRQCASSDDPLPTEDLCELVKA